MAADDGPGIPEAILQHREQIRITKIPHRHQGIALENSPSPPTGSTGTKGGFEFPVIHAQQLHQLRPVFLAPREKTRLCRNGNIAVVGTHLLASITAVKAGTQGLPQVQGK
jgi:hypothetical protein